MENGSKQAISIGGIQALDFGLTNGKSKCAYGSGSPSSSSDQEQNGDIGCDSFLGRSVDYPSEKLTPPFSDDENGNSEGRGLNGLNENTLAFSGLEVEESRLETTNNCSVSEGDLSVDMFAPTPAASKVNRTYMESEILVPATQHEDLSAIDSEDYSVVIHDSSFEEVFSSETAPHSYSGVVGSNPTDLNKTTHCQSETCYDVLVPATQPVEVASFDSDNPSTIECSDEENTIPSFVGTNTSTDDPKQALYNSTFTVSPSPMKLASRTFFKKKELKNIEEENATYVMDISKHTNPRGNLTYFKDLPQDSSNPSDTEVGKNSVINDDCEVEQVAEQTSDLGATVSGPLLSIHDESTLDLDCSGTSTNSKVFDPNSLSKRISVSGTSDSLTGQLFIPASDQMPISAQDNSILELVSKQPSTSEQVAELSLISKVPDVLKLPESVVEPTSNSEPNRASLSNSTVSSAESLKAEKTEEPSNEPFQRHIQSISSSPRKGKKLYAEPTPPVIKSLPAPKTPKSYSSSSESEEEPAAVAPAKKPGTPAKFKCYNKRGRDSKADREALFETENPRPTTSAALIRHNARGRKPSPKPKEPAKKVLKKRILPAKPKPKVAPEAQKVTSERRKLRLPPKIYENEDSATETGDDATSTEAHTEVPNPAPEVVVEVPKIGSVVVPEDSNLNSELLPEVSKPGLLVLPELSQGKTPAAKKKRINQIANSSEYPAGNKDRLAKLPEENAEKNPEIPSSNPSLVEAPDVQVSESIQSEHMPVLENQSLETCTEEPDNEMPQLQRVTRNRREPVNHQKSIKETGKPTKKRTRAEQPEVIQEPKSKPGPRSRKGKLVSTSPSKKLNSDPVIILEHISLPTNKIINSNNSGNSNAISNSGPLENSAQNGIPAINPVRSTQRKCRERNVIAEITLDSDTESSDSEYEEEEKSKRPAKKAKIERANKTKTKNKKLPMAGNNQSPAILLPPTPMKKTRSKLAEESEAPPRKKEKSTRGVSPAKKPAPRQTALKVKQDPPAPPKNDAVRRSGRERKPRKFDDGFVPLYFS